MPMGKRPWILAAAILLLFLPILPVAAAVDLFQTADERSQGKSLGPGGDWDSYSAQEARFAFVVDEDWKYLSVNAGFGGCCPEFPEGSALDVRVTGPGGQEYTFRVDDGECHDSKDYNPRYRCASTHRSGSEWIILVEPRHGTYSVIVEPAGAMEELPSSRSLVSGGTWVTQQKGNDDRLRGDNIWWYYPDGTSKFVEDGGFLGWREAWPRIVGYSVLALIGWVGSVVLFVMSRRRSKRGP